MLYRKKRFLDFYYKTYKIYEYIFKNNFLDILIIRSLIVGSVFRLNFIVKLEKDV